MFIEFLKNIRAKDLATTALIPAAFIATGECSLDEPQPKLFPATITSPFFTFLPNCPSILTLGKIQSSGSLERPAERPYDQ